MSYSFLQGAPRVLLTGDVTLHSAWEYLLRALPVVHIWCCGKLGLTRSVSWPWK